MFTSFEILKSTKKLMHLLILQNVPIYTKTSHSIIFCAFSWFSYLLCESE